MKLGDFEVPEVRLVPTTVDTLEAIYKVKKRDKIPSKDLAIFLGFKYGTEPHYYRKIRSLSEYGLIEGKGIFRITELGENLLHPRSDEEKKLSLTKSVLNVPLWKEIWIKHGKNPRDDNFWAVLMDITKVDPDTAKNNAGKILGWYLADIEHISESVASNDEITQPSEHLRSSSTHTNQMSQQMAIPEDSFGRVQLSKGGYIDVTDEATLEIAKSYIKVLEQKIKEKSKFSGTDNKE